LPTKTATATATVARRYFEALAARDLDAACAYWAADGHDHLYGQADLIGPYGVRAFFAELFGAIPDFSFEIVEMTTEDDRSAVRWRATGTFAGPGTWQGIEPTGARLELVGCDVCVVRDDLIVENHAYTDGMSIAREMGLMPPQGSSAERRMTSAFNLKTRLLGRLAAGEPERVADGVWLVRGDPLRIMNVYLIEDDGQLTMFDAGVRVMSAPLAAIATRMGGLKRIVLGHAHVDHRGAAAGLEAPIYCHPADREDAEGDGGRHYFQVDKLNPLGKLVLPRLQAIWDGGPVEIAGTVDEGDEIAGFRVVHLPGHAPGMIGLFRESDRLALTSDCFYTLDLQTGIKGRPRVPHDATNEDTEQARASIRKLAELEPSSAWPGHANALTGDVAEQLRRAASET
jgi:glyoxylase-like metal-dependent hydrolase (beta-lactamase superfamily II)/predicted ester cyclase